MRASIATARLSLSSIALDENGFILELVSIKGWLDFIGDRNINSMNDATAYIQNKIMEIILKTGIFRFQTM